MLDQQLLENFLYFTNERWQVHVNKDILKKPAPWTADPILKEYRFCNIRREDDRVTRWIAKNWREPANGHPSLPAAMLLARIVNVPGSLQEVGYPWAWDPEHFKKIINARMARGDKTWTGAYMVTGTESKGLTKAEYTCLIMDRAVPFMQFLPTNSLYDAAAMLCQIKGVSTFLAGQVIADLKQTGPWVHCPDWMSFALPGPGSVRGLHRLHGRNYNKGMPDKQFTEELSELAEHVLGRAPVQLHNQDLQNCLCEWDKYQRALNKQGTPKQTYVPSMEVY